MLSVGLTGGIGSGKSTFATYLLELGAEVIDADEIGRDAVATGKPAWNSIVDQFGDDVLTPDMEIDRARLAEIVFSDPAKLSALNAIVHPRIFERIAETFEMLADTDEIVVLDAALIVGTALEGMVDVLVVVEAPEADRRERLTSERRMSAADVEARMSSQLDPQRLREKADIVVVNDRGLGHLREEAERVWAELKSRRSA